MRNDIAALDKIWANDPAVNVFENGYANYGWLDYRNNHLAPEMKEFTNLKYVIVDPKIKVSGTTAWGRSNIRSRAKLSADTSTAAVWVPQPSKNEKANGLLTTGTPAHHEGLKTLHEFEFLAQCVKGSKIPFELTYALT